MSFFPVFFLIALLDFLFNTTFLPATFFFYSDSYSFTGMTRGKVSPKVRDEYQTKKAKSSIISRVKYAGAGKVN